MKWNKWCANYTTNLRLYSKCEKRIAVAVRIEQNKNQDRKIEWVYLKCQTPTRAHILKKNAVFFWRARHAHTKIFHSKMETATSTYENVSHNQNFKRIECQTDCYDTNVQSVARHKDNSQWKIHIEFVRNTKFIIDISFEVYIMRLYALHLVAVANVNQNIRAVSY